MIKKPQIDEKTLLTRTALGDEVAFKIIYEAYQSQVLTFANKYLKSRQHSEEVMQEVFLKLWNLKDKLNEINDLENYILTVTRNKAFDNLRQFKREARYVQSMPDNDIQENITEEKIMLEDTRQLLERGIDQLPPQQKRVYQLCHQQGLKYDEVATQLGISPQTVHRHMKLALSTLRKYLSQHTDLAILLIILKIM